jgi:peptide subunit release factor RF-3
MKKLSFILLLLVFTIVSCDDSVIKKPENLIKEKQMIKMLVDIHLGEATYNHFRRDSIMKNNSSANFYYSVLDKYQVPDSVFEQSFIYYASVPRNFEKMYQKVLNELSETEQEFSGRKEDLLELDEKKVK